MYYVVIDLEWNQYHNPLWTPESRSGVIMHEEIIQIGAVKTDESMTPVDTFNCFVRLGGRRRLDRYVKKLTGISESDLASGEDFRIASEQFAAWLADVDAIFSWGQDDRRVYLNNLAFYQLEPPACAWYDAQRIYSAQRPQHGPLALKHVAEEMGVRVQLSLHNAMNDAALTAICMSALDIQRGIEEYDLGRKAPAPGTLRPISTAKTHRHPSQQAAWDEACASLLRCPRCMQALTLGDDERGSLTRWYRGASCPDHGGFVLRGEFLGEKYKTLKLSFFEDNEETRSSVDKEFMPVTSGARARRRHRSKKRRDSVAVLSPDELLAKAVSFAAEAHRGQILNPGSSPYIVHPMEVCHIASTLTDDHAVLAAAMLHDTINLCPQVSADGLRAQFGDHVCALVEGAAQPSAEPSEEELILSLSDALSSLRALSRSLEAAPDSFWNDYSAEARAQMGEQMHALEALFKPLKRSAAFKEFKKLCAKAFPKEKV